MLAFLLEFLREDDAPQPDRQMAIASMEVHRYLTLNFTEFPFWPRELQYPKPRLD